MILSVINDKKRETTTTMANTETSHSENNKRIAKNTLLLYVRMLFSMLVSLYTSRVVLNTLGVEDYGIYNVVGGFVAMFSMISNSLSSSVSRFITFELGRGNTEKLKEIFSTSVLIHIALAAIVFILAETIGVWFLNTHMTIPADRLTAANWVFQASVISFMFGLFSVPYNASIVAHERMSAFAYIGILDVILRLLIVLFIAYVPLPYDKLIIYSLLIVAVNISLRQIYWWYCRKNFEECHLNWVFNKKRWKEMSSFAGWNFIGAASGLLKDQGVNILLNLYMGPVINAARGIAMSVNSAVNSFAGNFMTALNPQIIKSYASEDKKYTYSLVERGSRFSFYIILLFILPIILETNFILTIWLKQYPEHTVNFIRLILLLSLCDTLSNTLITLQLSTGKIRNYQLVVGGMQLMNCPLSYICLSIGLPPESTLITAIFISLSCLILRLLFLRKMTGLPITHYILNVCLNTICVAIIAAAIPTLIYSNMQQGLTRFLIVTTLCLISVSLSVYFAGCNKAERTFIMNKAISIKTKFVK